VLGHFLQLTKNPDRRSIAATAPLRGQLKTVEQALLALRYVDLTVLEEPLLADSVEKVGFLKLPAY